MLNTPMCLQQTGVAARRHLAAASFELTSKDDGVVVNIGPFSCSGGAALLLQQHGFD